MQTYYWNPWSMVDQLERSMYTAPTFEVEETEDATILTADVPGMRDSDIEVTVAGAYLNVRGARRRDNAITRSFERRIWIGDQFDPDQIEGSVADGVLAIRLVKHPRMKPRRIKLTSTLVDKVKGLLTGDKEKAA